MLHLIDAVFSMYTLTYPNTFAFDYISLRINVADFQMCVYELRTCEYFSFSFHRKTIDYVEHLLGIDCC